MLNVLSDKYSRVSLTHLPQVLLVSITAEKSLQSMLTNLTIFRLDSILSCYR